MELKIYLRILLKKWWVVLFAFLVTFTATIALTFTQTPTYRTTATFIVTPAGSNVTSFTSTLDMLGRRQEIAGTYSEVAVSRLIRQAVADELDLSPAQRKGLSVESRARAGTNVMEITAQGSDPVVVRDFANMVGLKTMLYVQDLYETFGLVSLDEALLPPSPIKPNKTLNLALGAVFGMVLGVGLAFLSDYLQTPLAGVASLGILDNVTGAYNERYFMQRLGEEMSRARRNKYPLSLALMNVDQLDVLSMSSAQAHDEALRKVTVFLKQSLREEDVMARLGEATFAFLLPDVTEEEAKATMEKLQTRMAWTPFEMDKTGIKINLNGAAGVAAYQYNGTRQDEFMDQANRTLQQAEATGYGKVVSFLELLSRDEDAE